MRSLILLFYFTVITTAEAAQFDDSDLQKWLAESRQNHSKMMIYSWSPHMVLSQLGMRELAFVDPKIEILVLLDPNANLELAKKIVREKGWPANFLRINNSPTLIKKGTRVHFPNYLFVQDGRWAGPIVTGFKSSNELNKIFKGISK